MSMTSIYRPQLASIQADLHTHSTCSDGSMTVEDIAKTAAMTGLTHVVITDHDTTRHFDAIRRLPSYANLTINGGVEITAEDPSTCHPAHILAYGIQYPHMVDSFCRPLRERRHECTVRQKWILEKHGCQFSNDLEKQHETLYPVHLLADLMRTGQIEELFGDFYQKYFTDRGPCNLKFEPANAFETVRVIKAAGGTAVLAHPGRDRNFSLIRRLIPFGLRGVELGHPAHSAADRMIIREFCEGTDLFLTGGSDEHGLYANKTQTIGEVRISDLDLSFISTQFTSTESRITRVN